MAKPSRKEQDMERRRFRPLLEPGSWIVVFGVVTAVVVGGVLLFTYVF